MRRLLFFIMVLTSPLLVAQIPKNCFKTPSKLFIDGGATMNNNPDEDLLVFNAGVSTNINKFKIRGLLGKTSATEGTGSWLEKGWRRKLIDSYTVDSSYTVNGITYYIHKEVDVYDTVPTIVPKVSVAEFKYMTLDLGADIEVFKLWDKVSFYCGAGALFQICYSQAVSYPPTGNNILNRRVIKSVRAERRGNIMAKSGVTIEYSPSDMLHIYYNVGAGYYLWGFGSKRWFVTNAIGLRFKINKHQHLNNGSKGH